MKRYRILFVLAATLLFATPSFAQLCGYCDRWGDCWAWGGLGTACDWDFNNWCYQWEEPHYCGGAGIADASALASEFAIASVEVVTPAGTTVAEPLQPQLMRTAELHAATSIE